MAGTVTRKRIRLPLGNYHYAGTWYFVTICCHEKAPLLQSQEHRELTRRLLVQFALGQNVELACYTILSDHLHFIASAGKSGLIGFVRDFKSATSRALRKSGIQYPVWQRSFFDHKVRTDESLSQKCQYVWMNPVRRGLVQKPEEYAWSGALREGRHYSPGSLPTPPTESM